MLLLKSVTKIDFMSHRKIAVSISCVLIVLSLLSIGLRGLNLGVDFTGGTLIEVGYPDSVELQPLRESLSESGFSAAIVQHFGTTHDVLIRIAPRDDLSKVELSDEVLRVLKSDGGAEMVLRRVEFVGPQVGEELTEDGGLAMLIALGAILVYVGLRFEYRFALGSVAALVHDVIITIGLFSAAGLEFDLTVLAAILAVIGYSLNDTIVVFDRVRENFRKIRKGTPVSIVNASLNQTLTRTLMTSLTTLLVLAALFVLGGELIHGFATALMFGVLVGTYSSIYIASTTVVALGVSKSDLMPVAKEGASAGGQTGG